MSNCVPFLYSLLVAILLLNPSLNLKSQSPKKQHPFNDKTEDGVKFRLQDQRRNLQVQNDHSRKLQDHSRKLKDHRGTL